MAKLEGECQPLCWPDYWDNRSDLQEFLRGVPFLGIDRKAWRYFRSILRSRKPASLRLWGVDPEVLYMIILVSPIIKEEMEWPNVFFVPDDPCDILFFDPTTQMLSVDALTEIESILDLDEAIEALDDVNKSYGQFIDRLITLKKQAGGSVHS